MKRTSESPIGDTENQNNEAKPPAKRRGRKTLLEQLQDHMKPAEQGHSENVCFCQFSISILFV